MSVSASTQFIWVRHFPVLPGGAYVGQSDLDAVVPPIIRPDLLSITGAKLPDDAVWLTSPLARAHQTMQWLRESLQCQDGEVVSIPELMEQSFGEWEGKRYDDIWLESAAPETIQPPNGETFLDVTRRVHAWINQAVLDYAGRTLIITCHAGVIRSALGHALAIPAGAALRFQLDHASCTRTSYIAHNRSAIGRVEAVNMPLLSGGQSR